MARIEGVNLPTNKRIEYGLTYVYGVGLKLSRDILNKLKINFDKRVKELSDEEIASIQKEISSHYLTEGDLRKEIRNNIKRLQDIGSYRGLRHKSHCLFVVKVLKLMLAQEKVRVKQDQQLH